MRLTNDRGEQPPSLGYKTPSVGDDLVVGGEGTDDISGGWGDDTLRSRDGSSNDSVSCGPNLDFAEVDVGDSVSGDCEDVERF